MTTLNENIKIYTNMVEGIKEDYKLGDTSFDTYKSEIVYYTTVLNNLRRKTENRLEWL